MPVFNIVKPFSWQDIRRVVVLKKNYGRLPSLAGLALKVCLPDNNIRIPVGCQVEKVNFKTGLKGGSIEETAISKRNILYQVPPCFYGNINLRH
jgi:hypothetical protein